MLVVCCKFLTVLVKYSFENIRIREAIHFFVNSIIIINEKLDKYV